MAPAEWRKPGMPGIGMNKFNAWQNSANQRSTTLVTNTVTNPDPCHGTGLTSRGFVAAGDTAVPPLSTVVLLAPALSSASSLFLRRRVCCSARPAVVRHHRHNGWLTPTDPRLNVRAGRGLRRTLGCVLGPDRETTCPAAAAVSGGNVSFSAAGIDVCGCTVETTTVADCRRCRPPPSVDGCCR